MAFEKVSNVRAVEVWEVGRHISVVNGLRRNRAEAGRPHTTLPHLSVFFPMGAVICTFVFIMGVK